MNRPAGRTLAVLALSYLAGSIPIANVMSRAVRGVDLRHVGNGKVSGSALYEVAGFGPLALAGCVELAKGMVGPLLAGRRRPLLGAAAAACAIVGHDWSPWLGFRGGRGVSLVLGGGLVLAPETTALVGAGLGLGKLAHQTGAGTFAGLVVTPLVLARTRPPHGALVGAFLVAPVLLKRVLADGAPIPDGVLGVLRRLVADQDRLGPPAGGAR